MLRSRNLLRVTGVLAALLTVAGCSALPRSGPDGGAVESSAVARLGNPGGKTGIDYVLVDVNKSLMNYVLAAPSPASATFGMRGGGSPELPLGVGDVVSVAVFEAGAGGLFIPADAGSRPGNFITLPNQRIDKSGTLTVPYAGRIQATGRTVDAVQRDIENALANRAIEPQVLVTVLQSRSAEVSVLGDVNSPAKLELNPNGERILDVISRAGGLATPGVETYVTLQRGGRQSTVLFDDIVANPRENVYVVPGDTVYINRERRTYLAFGATGLSGRFDFAEANLTLGDALGKAGGLLDERADPTYVLVYRQVSKAELAKVGADVTRFTEDTVPVVFRANLRDPSAFFAVQQFPMQDKDILFVSNAKSVEITKFLSVVNTITSGTAGPIADVANAKSAIRSIGD
ncbi:polysaccharide biosynthesis/export family protein [Chthonobacter albigriseus]|uniref:polysaccharide biosynthesis/export family protein n=1 Tax=Chthonobacter albigriseus TaxID=1683161 RepID=UPI0015EF13DC|nr:polysaccharide biosynthesis/export family protein [Chthonobacter albigriseus]